MMDEASPARGFADRLIALCFMLGFGAMAAILALLGSVHGPEGFAYIVFGWLVIAGAALWSWFVFLRRRGYRRKTLLLLAGALAVGAAMIVAANASWGLLVNLEIARNERLAAATQVLDMRDEMLLTPQGNPIGVRLKYTVRFPRSDYFWQSASLESGNRYVMGVWADGRRVSELIEPPMAAAANGVQRYERGKTYHFTTEFLPNFLMWNPQKTSLCIVNPPPDYALAFRGLMANPTVFHFGITVSGTEYRGRTEHAYDLRAFYQSAKKEGAAQLQGSGFGGATSPCN